MSFDLKLLFSQPIVPQAMIIVLTCVLLVEIYLGVGTLFKRDNTMKNQVIHTNSLMNKAKNSTSTGGLNTHFFGDYIPIDIASANVKATMLDLKIVGILFSSKNATSQVIIQTSGGAQKTYFVGDTVTKGVVIRKITPEGVLLAHHGLLESLSLPNEALSFEPQPKPLDF